MESPLPIISKQAAAPQSTPTTPTPQPTKTALMTTRKASKNKWLMLVGVLVLASVGTGWWWSWQKAQKAQNSASGLITEVVKRGDLLESVSATGSVTAQTGAQIKIGSQITGRIKKLSADVGSNVKAGQVIAELDLPDVQAQLSQAQANLAVAQTKQAQQQSGVVMQQTQTQSAIIQAEAGRTSALAKLRSAQAAANLQYAQTPASIEQAQNSLASAKAALATATSNLIQTQEGANLQTANATQKVRQAQATAKNSALNLQRQQELLTDGAVAQSIVDQAQATASVNQSMVNTAEQDVLLVQQKVTADINVGKNAITQAKQGVKTAQSALVAAEAGRFLDAVKRASVGDARAALSQQEANLVLARGNTAQNTLKLQDVRQAKESVRVASAQVAYSQAQVDKTLIRSPISGTVLQLASQQGETLAAGLSSPTLIVVADLSKLQVDAYVDETDIGKVQMGQQVVVTVDAFSNKEFSGRVTKIASGSTIQQGVITYDVTISLVRSEYLKYLLKPDMTAAVTIQTGKLTGVLLVPSEAVKTGTKGTTINILHIKDKKATTESRKVIIGGSDGVSTEIREGLKEGETVILAGALKTTNSKMGSSKRGGGDKSQSENSGPQTGGSIVP
jgi:HlyD family secretion protein